MDHDAIEVDANQSSPGGVRPPRHVSLPHATSVPVVPAALRAFNTLGAPPSAPHRPTEVRHAERVSPVDHAPSSEPDALSPATDLPSADLPATDVLGSHLPAMSPKSEPVSRETQIEGGTQSIEVDERSHHSEPSASNQQWVAASVKGWTGIRSIDVASRAERIPHRIGRVDLLDAGPAAAILVTVLLVTGIGLGALLRPDAPTVPAGLAQAQEIVLQARAVASGGDVDGAVTALTSAATAAQGDVRRELRQNAAEILVAAASRELSSMQPGAAVRHAEMAATFDDTTTGAVAQRGLSGVLLAAAREAVAAGDASPDAEGWLRQVLSATSMGVDATSARTLLTTAAPVRANVSVAGHPGVGVTVILLRPASPDAPSPVAVARVAADGAGRADLGAVTPGLYSLAYVGADHTTRAVTGSAGAVRVGPVRVNVLTVDLPADAT